MRREGVGLGRGEGAHSNSDLGYGRLAHRYTGEEKENSKKEF